MKKILQKEADVLRQKSENVPLEKISSAQIKKVILEMKIALESQDDGVAIAAPQIGYPLCIFVVSHRVAKITHKPKSVENVPGLTLHTHDSVFITPLITQLSHEKKLV